MNEHDQREAALKPCPFCGNRAILRMSVDEAGRLEWASASCDFTRPDHCDAHAGVHEAEETAIAAWNRRTSAPPETPT